ncbi:hypothetical protein [Leptodesmis sp.]|uniref:hypothetical protein n=1 Tax=Leptodesmis sp. TaxID=3100501 RepID=UPI004053476A
MQSEQPLSLQTQRKLEQFQTRWNLKPEDVEQVEAQLLKQFHGSQAAISFTSSESAERLHNWVAPTVDSSSSPMQTVPPSAKVPVPDVVEVPSVVHPPKEHTTRFGWVLAIVLVIAAGAGYGGFQLISKLSEPYSVPATPSSQFQKRLPQELA